MCDGAPDWLAMLEGVHQHSDNAMGHDDARPQRAKACRKARPRGDSDHGDDDQKDHCRDGPLGEVDAFMNDLVHALMPDAGDDEDVAALRADMEEAAKCHLVEEEVQELDNANADNDDPADQPQPPLAPPSSSALPPPEDTPPVPPIVPPPPSLERLSATPWRNESRSCQASP